MQMISFFKILLIISFDQFSYFYIIEMLVPQFKLNQSERFVTVQIRVPYVKISSCQFYIQSTMFKFYLKPYMLTLGFQQKLKQVQQPAKAVYYHEKHILVVDLEKQNIGQEFENLNLLSSLLSKNSSKKGKDTRVLVELVQEKEGKLIIDENSEKINPYSYGFCGNYQEVLKDRKEECAEIFMFDPSDVSIDERYDLSRKIVEQNFDQDGYMFDKVSNSQEIDRIVQGKWDERLIQILQKLKKQPYTFEKFKTVTKIPKKQIIVNPKIHQTILNQLISISFCYLYEYACMEGQLSVQSAKTINQTSAVLSCNISYHEIPIQAVIYDCCRRCVTYSLYKHIDICKKVCRLLGSLLNLNLLIEMLLQIRIMFEKCDPRYLLNRIYIDDYCTYVFNEDLNKYLSLMRQKIQVLGEKISEKGLELQIQEQEEQEEEQEEETENQAKLKNQMENLQLENLLSLD